MSEQVKSTIIGTTIIGLFMMICTLIATNKVEYLAHKAKNYINTEKTQLKRVVKHELRVIKDVVKIEKRKAKEVALEFARINAGGENYKHSTLSQSKYRK